MNEMQRAAASPEIKGFVFKYRSSRSSIQLTARSFCGSSSSWGMKGLTVNEKSAQSSIALRVGSAITEQGKRCNGGEIDGW